jgi:branched-chain amino acid transport system ATP-binding protein
MQHREEAGRGQAPASLETIDVAVYFQGVRAIDGVSLTLSPGEILGLIGPNGAGKTTLVNVLTGFQQPGRGAVKMGGQDITGLVSHKRSRLGLARTFQNVLLFGGLSVIENVEAGAIAAGLDRHAGRKRAWETLEWLNLAHLAHRRADTLPFGEERRVGIGRALCGQPTFLLLDEPAAGLNTAECDELHHIITGIRREYGCGVLLIEHKMPLVFGLCDRIQVLDQGRTIALGAPSSVAADPAVRQAYLGDEVA